MVVLPLSRVSNDYDEGLSATKSASEADPMQWVRIAAASSLVASGALLLGGKRRAGLAAAATGTVLALLDQQDTLKSWWQALPGYIDGAQHLISQAEGAVKEFSAQREKLGRAFGR